MLNAAEAAMDASAEDDAERERNRARLYAPPPEVLRQRRQGSTRTGVPRSQVMDMMSQMAAQDAALLAGRGPGR